MQRIQVPTHVFLLGLNVTEPTIDFDMNAAPLRIGTVTLKVRALETVSTFYERVLGLSIIARNSTRIVLGSGTVPLVTMEGDESLEPVDPRQAGLFHTAFLLPSRSDLAQWMAHAAESQVMLLGASDHTVSEALYLSDPEDNGIEMYADRPSDQWQTATGKVQMANDPLNLQDLRMAAGDRVWNGFPDGGRIGHVHLRVGDTQVADQFYHGILGFDLSATYPGASFYGSGGYHHQLAGNVWKSRHAGLRRKNMAGLGAVGIITQNEEVLEGIARRAERSDAPAERSKGALVLLDPWGTRLDVTAGH